MSDAQKKMDDEEFDSIISGLATDAADFVDGTLSPQRAVATQYYLGEKLGNEEEGRSQYVHTIVRDSVLAVLPSFLRVIFGAEHPVEFVPTKAESVPMAEQATDYVRQVFMQDNNGFMLTHAVAKDALVRKIGIYKIGWDDSTATTTYALQNVEQSQLETLVASDEVELLRAKQVFAGTEAVVVDGQPVQPAQEPRYDIEVKHTEKDGRCRVWTLPPEELLVSRDGRDLATATLVGHRTRKKTSELLSMGVPQKDIDEYGGIDSRLRSNSEALERQTVVGGNYGSQSLEQTVEAGEANDDHEYGELYPFVDYDGDGIAELRRVCTIGPMYHVISNEPASERPFYTFTPDPEPHTWLGQSWADRLMDLQKMTSSVVRANADSLALSIFPRSEVVEGEVNMLDLDNTEIGAHVRVKKPGMLREIAHTYVGKESFPLLEFLDNAQEMRTGQDKGAMGLDADALQSTEKAAAGAAITASQGQVEMLVRIFTEQTLKPLFRGILRTLVENQPKQRMMKLRGKWVPVNPASWDANMDVQVNVALGTSLVEKKIAAILQLAAKQELVLATVGPVNPIVSPAQYSYTLRKLTELSNFKDVDNFFSQVPADYQPPAPQAPAPDPMVAVKMQELQMKDQHQQQNLAIEQLKLQAEIQQKEADRQQALAIAQEEIRLKLELGAAEIDAKYNTQLAIEQLRARVETTAEIAKSNREIANNQLEHERTVAQMGVDHHHAEIDHEHTERELDIKEKVANKPTPKKD